MDKDLNLANYTVKELLEMFGLDSSSGRAELQAAKRLALSTHPDKSGLPKEHFDFFWKAYQVIESIFPSQRETNRSSSTEIPAASLTMDDGFVEKFNRTFEECCATETTGHGDWLKAAPGEEETKNELQVIPKGQPTLLGSTAGSELAGEPTGDFGGSWFHDLKSAHTPPGPPPEFQPRGTLQGRKNERSNLQRGIQ